MFSRVLVKLVDQAIVPAMLLLAVRIISVFVISRVYGLSLMVGSEGFIFENSNDYLLVNSYSVLMMSVFMSVGVIYILLKSYLFHDSHIQPVLTAKLFSLRLTYLIQSSFDLYSQGTVWLSYMYLLTFASAGLTYFGLIYTWVFITTLILTLISTGLLIYDIEQEVSGNTLVIKEEYSDIEEDYVLRFGGEDA